MIVKKIVALSILLFLSSGCDGKVDNSSRDTNSSTPKEKVVAEDKNTTIKTEKIRDEVKFSLETIDGKTLNIKEMPNGLKFEEFDGKPVFLIFFGHRCPPCLREIPRLIEFTKKHKDLEIVALEVQGLDNDALKEFAQEKGIKYNLVSGYSYMDFISYIQSKAGWGGAIPFILGINTKGDVKFIKVGGLYESDLEMGYKELIKP
jgi:thiol-disulfide isomerase/thioredoxin